MEWRKNPPGLYYGPFIWCYVFGYAGYVFYLAATGAYEIVELEKIEMTRQLDKVYRLDHAVTKTQKVILSAFDMDWNYVKYRAENISRILKGVQ